MIVRLHVEPTGDVVQSWLAPIDQNAEPKRASQKLDAETFALLREKLEEVLRYPESAHFASELRRVGEQLYRLLLPPTVRAELAEVSDPVLVETPLVGIPWDLLHDGDDFLGLRFALGISSHVAERYDPTSPPPSPGRLRVLLIGSDPRGDLGRDPEGESSIDVEIGRLAARLRHTTDLHLVNRNQAEFHTVAGFLGQGFDLIHYCGHVVRAPDGEPALLLADEVLFKSSIIQGVLRGRPLVFVSGCASGRDLARVPEPRWGRLLGGVADGFLLGGAKAVIATHCNVHDLVAPELAEQFYMGLLAGHAVGESLRDARAAVRARYPESPIWLSFGLVGHPGLVIDSRAGGLVDRAPSVHAIARRRVFMITDIAEASALRNQLGVADYAHRASVHDRLFRGIAKSIPGARILRDLGDGFVAQFETARDAVEAGLRFQQGLASEQPAGDGLRARLSIDLGEAAEVDAGEPGRAKVVGSTDLASRTVDVALPGQILLTRAAFDETRAHPNEWPGDTPVALQWIAHGQYVIKGIDEPVELFEVGEPGIAPLAAPPDTEQARRRLEDEDLLGWRPAVGASIPHRENWILDERLGTGSFGEVWLAHRSEDGERRVFKFCFDARHLRSFRRELRILNLLSNELGTRPDIARLYDVQLARPPYFLESEYAPGGSLTQWATRKGGIGALSLDTRLELFTRTASALAVAHAAGVLHRDLKPGNILIYEGHDGSPRPCLSDFGIGLLTDRSRLQGDRSETTSQTEDREEPSAAGTRPYQPPETLLGAPHTVEGDVYALGVLLFQLVVADLTAPMGIGFGALVTDPLLRADIEAMVDRDPARRLHSAAEAAERVRGLTARRTRAESEARLERERVRTRRRRRGLTIGAASACLLALVASWGLRQRDRVEHAEYLRLIDAAREAIEAERHGEALGQLERASARHRGWEWYRLRLLATPVFLETDGASVSLGPDGRFVIAAPDERRVWPARGARPLDGGEAFCFAEWMPGGDHVVTVPRATAGPPSIVIWDRAHKNQVLSHPLRVSAVDERNPVRVIDGCLPGIETSYSTDGSRMLLSGPGVRAVVIDDGSSLVHDLPVSASGVQLSPDGRSFAGTIGGSGLGAVGIWDTENGSLTASFPINGPVRHISLQSNSRGHVTGILISDGRSVELRDVATGRTLWEPNGESHFAGWLTPDGQSAVTQDLDGTVRVWDLATNAVTASVAAPSATFKLQFSKSGHMVLGASWYDHVWVWTIGAPTPTFLFRAGNRDAPVHKATAVVRHLELSDDGSKALVVSKPHGRPGQRLHILDTSERRGERDVDRPIGKMDRAGRVGLVDGGESATVIDLSEGWPVRELRTWNTDSGAAAWFNENDELLTLGRDGAVQISAPISGTALRSAILSGFPAISARQLGLQLDAGKVFDSAMRLEMRGALEEDDSEGGPIDRFQSKLGPKVRVRHAGDRIAVSKSDVVKIWSTTTGAEIGHIPMHGATGFMLSPDGTRILLGWTTHNLENKRLELWDVDAARLVRRMPCSTSLAPNVFSDDSRRLLTGCWAGSADVWDAGDGSHVRDLRPISGHLYDGRFNQAATKVVTVSFDGPLQVWNLDSSDAPLTLSSTGRYHTADISDDGARVIAANGNGSLELWDATVGHELLTLDGIQDAQGVPWVRFLRHGAGIVVVNDGRSRIWRVDAGSGEKR